MDYIINTIIFGCVGVAAEVSFTALAWSKEKKNKMLIGHSYLWMLPIYALGYPILDWLWPAVSEFNIIWRGLIYTLLIFAVEYISGWLLRKGLGQCPWENRYKDKKWNIGSLIRLDYAPIWFGFSLIMEQLYLYLAG